MNTFNSTVELLASVRDIALGIRETKSRVRTIEERSLKAYHLTDYPEQLSQACSNVSRTKRLKTISAIADYMGIHKSTLSRLLSGETVPSELLTRTLYLLRLGASYRLDAEAEAAAVARGLLQAMSPHTDISAFEVALADLEQRNGHSTDTGS